MPQGSIKKIVFGSDLDPKIKNKLIAKQHLAGNNPSNDNVEFVEVNGKKPSDIKEALGGIGRTNFSQNGSSMLDLSSRTPFIRMWTCVQLHYFDPKVKIGEKVNIQNYTLNQMRKAGHWNDMLNLYGAGAVLRDDFRHKVMEYEDEFDQKEDIDIALERKVYVVGNNVLNILDEADPTAPINPETQSRKNLIKEVGKSGETLGSGIFPNELESNSFYNPPALIKSVNSDTEGVFGAIKRTTVTFHVFNFQDFEDIYCRYFLKPAAQIIVDFGWDTANLYDPNDIVDSDKLQKLNKGNSFDEVLYGKDGYIEENAGDLEIIVGHVVSFDSKVQTDGSFECTMELISKNASLLDHSFTEADSIKATFVSGLSPYIINLAAGMFEGGDFNFLRNNWKASKENLTESTAYANTFAQKVFGHSESKDVSIQQINLDTGVYWQAINSKGTISDNRNLYIMWGFFEDELLNKELSIGLNEGATNTEDIELGNLASKFDSSESYVKFDTHLDRAQNFSAIGKGNSKTKLDFLYPPNWDDTYNTVKEKVPSFRERELAAENADLNSVDGMQYESGAGESNAKTVTQFDKYKNRIPFRELFINVSIISEAFKTKDTINDAILFILDEISKDSAGVFDLKLYSPDKTNSLLEVVDANMSAKVDDSDEDVGDKIFEFQINSNMSIVKSLDLTFQSPKGGTQDMISIQNSPGRTPVLIDNNESDSQNSLRGLNLEDMFYVNYIPSIGDYDQQKKQTKKINKPVNRKKQNSELNINPDHRIKLNKYSDLMNDLKTVKEGVDSQYNLTDNIVKLDDTKKALPGIEEASSEQEMYPNKFFVESIEDYFRENARTEFFKTESTPIVYIESGVSIYGISGIVPGNIFKLSYIPNPWRGKVFFQIKKVSHSIDDTTWTTSFETLMKVKRKVKKDYHKMALYKENIQMSQKFLNSLWPVNYSNLFTDIKIHDNIEPVVFTMKRFKILEGHSRGCSTVTETKEFSFQPDIILSAMAVKDEKNNKVNYGGFENKWIFSMYPGRGCNFGGYAGGHPGWGNSNPTQFGFWETDIEAGHRYFIILYGDRYMILTRTGENAMTPKEFCEKYPLPV
jgi:hypothetical protein